MNGKCVCKNLITMFLVLALIITMLPLSVHAAGYTGPEEPSINGRIINVCVYPPDNGKTVKETSGGSKVWVQGNVKIHITEIWTDLSTGKDLSTTDKFYYDKTYQYRIYTVIERLKDGTCYNMNMYSYKFNDDCPKFTNKNTFIEEDGALGFTGQFTLTKKDHGRLKVDLSSTSTKIEGTNKTCFWNFLNNLGDRITKTGTSPSSAASQYEGNVDLDKDGKPDFSYSGMSSYDLKVIAGTKIKGSLVVALNSEELKKANSNDFEFFSSVEFVFPTSDTPTPPDRPYSIGEGTIDLTSGFARIEGESSVGALNALIGGMMEGTLSAVGESLDSGIIIDLGNDGTNDIKVVGDEHTCLEITVLPACAIKGSYTITISKETIDASEDKAVPYYEKLTLTFTKDETGTGTETGKETETNKIAPTVEGTMPDAHKVGDVIANSGATYTITSVDEGKQSVTYKAPESATATSANIPASITVDGKEFKVTEIAPGAFKGNKKLKKVTIGKNIVKIGAKAFFKCKNLKTVNVKTTSLTKSSVGSNAFKGIHEKAKVKVPKKKLAAYQRIFKARGVNGKTQKITK